MAELRLSAAEAQLAGTLRGPPSRPYLARAPPWTATRARTPRARRPPQGPAEGDATPRTPHAGALLERPPVRWVGIPAVDSTGGRRQQASRASAGEGCQSTRSSRGPRLSAGGRAAASPPRRVWKPAGRRHAVQQAENASPLQLRETIGRLVEVLGLLVQANADAGACAASIAGATPTPCRERRLVLGPGSPERGCAATPKRRTRGASLGARAGRGPPRGGSPAPPRERRQARASAPGAAGAVAAEALRGESQALKTPRPARSSEGSTAALGAASSKGATPPPLEHDPGPYALLEESPPLPPNGESWDWPLSRHEKKSRLTALDRCVLMADNRLLEREVQMLRARSPVCAEEARGSGRSSP
uniref:Uncharacterized protein n=1 Tax=Alexandrium monilatum TaxID=311494 RepID=A0A7S4V2W5_9DINO